MSENFLVFMMMIAALYLFEGLWDGFHGKSWEKLGKFCFLSGVVTVIKIGVKVAVFVINL